MKILIIIGSDVYARRVIKCIEALIKIWRGNKYKVYIR